MIRFLIRMHLLFAIAVASARVSCSERSLKFSAKEYPPVTTKDANIICSAVEDWARLGDSSQPGGLLFR